MAHSNGNGSGMVPLQGEILPSERSGPPEGNDFSWVRPGFLDRWRGARVAKTINGLTGGLEIATRFQRAAIDYEQARQDLVYARERAALLPLKLEQDRKRVFAEILELDSQLEAIFQRRELAQADHEIALLEREEERLAAKIRLKRLKLEKKQLKTAKQQEPAAPKDDSPEPFQRHWATEKEVQKNRSAADIRIDAIYAQAKAERRQLTADEIEEIDALANAAEGAESEVRRRAASDLR